jgi:hypothetical protein
MIKKFNDFILEVSGTELVGQVAMGAAYGDVSVRNKTINTNDTDVIYSELGGHIYTIDEYNEMYHDYLKSGGRPLMGFNKENLEIIIAAQQEQQ